MDKIIEVNVRGVMMFLNGGNRSLDLCARMNYETEVLDFIDTIPNGETFYDLGACEGRFSIYAALKGLDVIAFEPEQKNFEGFKKNISLNLPTINKIKPFNLGVGDANKDVTLNIGQPWVGGHQKIVDYGNEYERSDLNFVFKEFQKISLVSLDSIIEKENLPKPSYLKIDIDGSELPFLKGAFNNLKGDSGKKIIFELNENDKAYGEIISILKRAGFDEEKRYPINNEPNLYNILFSKQ